MANKYVQYGAALAGAAALPGVTKAVGTMYNAASTAWSAAGGASNFQQSAAGAIDAVQNSAGTAYDQAIGSISSTLQNPQFLVTAGLGLAGLALGSGSSRPSLNFPALATTAIVALNVADMIKSGQAASSTSDKISAGTVVGESLNFSLRNPVPANLPQTKLSRFDKQGRTDVLTYPLDLGTKKLTLDLFTYQRYSWETRSLTNSRPHTTIELPMPATLTEAFNSVYSDVQLGAIGGELFKAAQAGFNDSDKSLAASLGDTVNAFTNALDNSSVSRLLIRRLVSAAAPEAVGTGIDLFAGNVPNPHLTVAFKGVSLRAFSYTWRFSPNSLKESQTVEAIIHQLQAASLPERDGPLLLGFPNVVMPRVTGKIIEYKPCVIDSVGVNYAPSGNPSFFKTQGNGGKLYPTEVEVTIGLKELEIFTANDPRFESITAGSKFVDSNVNYNGEGDTF